MGFIFQSGKNKLYSTSLKNEAKHMLKKLYNKVFGTKQQVSSQPKIYSFNEHKISRDQLSFAAEKVVKRLQDKGYEAYVVGGAVRDLLLGLQPKDFDVATNANPEEIRRLFRRSRIIGRRFKIVHVMVGPETIEVTTFRGGEVSNHNEHGRIMRDNNFGTQQEDASRRDFTCNALYYNAKDQTIIDYCQSVKDIRAKKLVIIGDAKERYQEDPVRILRAIRLSAKLGFSIDGQTKAQIANCSILLKDEPPARLFDELLKLLLSGHSEKSIQLMQQYNLQASNVFPLLKFVLGEKESNPFAQITLKNTDDRLQNGKHVSIGFILAALLWQPVYLQWQHNIQQKQKSVPALIMAMNEIRDSLDKRFAIPKRFTSMMREIWLLQPHFESRVGNRPYRLLGQIRFRAAYDFMLIRTEVGELPKDLASWWTTFQNATEPDQAKMIAEATAIERKSHSPRKRRYTNKKRQPSTKPPMTEGQ